MTTMRVMAMQAAQAALRDLGMPSRSRGSYEVGVWGGDRRIQPTSANILAGRELRQSPAGDLARALPKPCA